MESVQTGKSGPTLSMLELPYQYVLETSLIVLCYLFENYMDSSLALGVVEAFLSEQG